MLPEYDFTGGVRGKHYKVLREGYTVKISQADGTTLYQVELWDRQIEEVLAHWLQIRRKRRLSNLAYLLFCRMIGA